MIKINLLQSAVENTNLDVVENAISNRGTQQTLLLLIASGACVLAMFLDFYITRRDHSRVKTEVDTEQATADRLQQVTKQAKDLQDKNKSVEERISAIMRLRSEQTGPLRLLQMVDGKLPANNSVRLVSVKQETNNKPEPKDPKNAEPKEAKADLFIINGYSPNEADVIAFAKNIEFSDGWFSKFTVDTRRVVNPDFKEQGKDSAAAKKTDGKIPKDAFQFVIKCTYNPQNILVNGNSNTTPPPQPNQPVSQPATAPNKPAP